MPYTVGNPVSIYYKVHGNQGSPLLLIMGLGATLASWSPEQIEQLSQEHQVILFDNRGTGHSEKLTTAYTMTDLALDTISVLDALNIRKAHVLGVSMGGMIAQHVALNHPDRVLSLLLGCTAPTGNVNHPRMIPPSQEVLMELLMPPSGNRAQDIEVGWKRSVTAEFIASNRDLLVQLRDRELAYPECPADAQELQLIAISSTHDTYEQLGRIQQPTLIQTGTEDIMIPAENSRQMARLIPGARLIEYPNCGHDFLIQGGEKAVADILAFVREVDKQGEKA